MASLKPVKRRGLFPSRRKAALERLKTTLQESRSRDFRIRQQAIEKLGGLKEPKAVSRLVDLAINEPRDGLRARAATLLRSRKAWKVKLPVLTEILTKHEEPVYRARAAISLGALKVKTSLPLLLDKAKKDQSVSVRAASVRSLANFPAKQVQPALKAWLTDPERMVRQSASQALAEQIGLRKVSELVAELDYSQIPVTHLQSKETVRASRAVSPELARTIRLKRRNAPKETHRGQPVYFMDFPAKWTALHYFGSTLINKAAFRKFGPELEREFYDKRFWEEAAEHERGEFIDHQVGLAMELLYAHKKGRLKDYLAFWQKANDIAFGERANLIAKDLPQLKKFIPKPK